MSWHLPLFPGGVHAPVVLGDTPIPSLLLERQPHQQGHHPRLIQLGLADSPLNQTLRALLRLTPAQQGSTFEGDTRMARLQFLQGTSLRLQGVAGV